MSFLLLRDSVPLRLFNSQEEARIYLTTLLTLQMEGATFSIYQVGSDADACIISQHFRRKPLGVLRHSNFSDNIPRLGTSL